MLRRHFLAYWDNGFKDMRANRRSFVNKEFWDGLPAELRKTQQLAESRVGRDTIQSIYKATGFDPSKL